MSWATIRTGFKTRLNTISGLVVFDRTPVALADDDVAIVEIAPPGIQPSGLGAMTEVNVRVIIIVNRATVTDSEGAIDAYLWPVGTNSIVAAVKGDTTLGGAVDDVVWMGSGYPYGTPEGMATARQSEVLFRCALSSA